MGTPWKGEAEDARLSRVRGWRHWSSGLPSPTPRGRERPAASPAGGRSQLGLFEYVQRELTWGRALEWNHGPPRGLNTINFLRVPLHLEPFMLFGHAICADLFIFHFTYLPVRWCAAVGHAASSALRAASGARGGASFTRSHAYDVLKGVLILLSVWALGAVEVGRLYHYIRGEAIIKLYVIFSILEIFDRLASSLGQDVLDALYRTVRDLPPPSVDTAWRVSAPGLARLAFHFSVACVYVVAHSLILFVQVVCLNVAINSRNNALLTLLISNNFVELKSSVFKRFEAENLFQISCADVVERFQLSLFLGLIALQEFTSLTVALTLLPAMASIFACEVVVDCLKHSFISKFNRLHADLYGTFTAILSHDLVGTRKRMAVSLDPTHACVKRLGLPTVPLVVVVLRIILLKIAPTAFPRFSLLHPVGVLASVAFLACLFAAKSLLGMALLARAATSLRAQKQARPAVEGGKSL
jgi:hypothetical protein